MKTEGFSKDSNVKPVSMLRFLSKELAVETTFETIGSFCFGASAKKKLERQETARVQWHERVATEMCFEKRIK